MVPAVGEPGLGFVGAECDGKGKFAEGGVSENSFDVLCDVDLPEDAFIFASE